MRILDGQRAGTVWAMLYYPTSLPVHPQPGAAPAWSRIPPFGDPTGILPVMTYDQHGRVYFRNRWKDEHDIQVSINADTHRHSHAWDMPEATAINILAGNNRFVGGPGKAGGNPKKDPGTSSLVLCLSMVNTNPAVVCLAMSLGLCAATSARWLCHC